MRLVALLVTWVVLLVAASPAGAATDQWVVALGEEAESLDPPSSILYTSDVYQQHIFDALIGIEGDDLRLVGLLAERWETTPDGTIYTFHLRRGVTFHDGSPLTARTVVASWHRALDPATKSGAWAKPERTSPAGVASTDR